MIKNAIAVFLFNIVSKKFMATIFGILVIVFSKKIGVELTAQETMCIVAMVMGEQVVQGIKDILDIVKKYSDKLVKTDAKING